MAGCTNCAAKTGCTDRKGDMFAALEDTLARLYPTRTWGEPDDQARFEAGISESDGMALCEELSSALDAATFYRPGEPDEYCDYIYVLCLGRQPCLVQIRDGGVPLPEELGDTAVSELYLRVCLSQMARMAGVQQVAMDMDMDMTAGASGGRGASAARGDRIIRERPRSGVYDAPLLHRFQRLVALLPAYDIRHLDFGEISAPPAGFDPGQYAASYGGEPHTANYLFYPQPSTMQSVCLLPGGA